MANAPLNENNDVIQSFLLDKKPHGLFLLPMESRQCAATPSARKYKMPIAASRSKEKLVVNEPHAANDTTIPVYGKNNSPIPILKLFEPNFGTNHSDVLSFCMVSLCILLLII